jgi:hypothetical protein
MQTEKDEKMKQAQKYPQEFKIGESMNSSYPLESTNQEWSSAGPSLPVNTHSYFVVWVLGGHSIKSGNRGGDLLCSNGIDMGSLALGDGGCVC